MPFPNPSTPTVVRKPPNVAPEVVPAIVRRDIITRKPRGGPAFSTGKFTGASAVQFQGMLYDSSSRWRIRKIWWQMGEDAAISGGAAEATLKLRDNQLTTGYELTYFVPAASVSGVGVEVSEWDLGDGYVSTEGGILDVLADVTLTSGTFRVVIQAYPDKEW